MSPGNVLKQKESFTGTHGKYGVAGSH